MSPRRYFSLDQANRAILDVAPLLARLREVQGSALQTKERLDLLWQRLETGEPVLDEIATLQQRLDADSQEFGSIVGGLEEIGCLLRDVEVGLVDFPAHTGSSEIYLCWKLGEDVIHYWHGLDEGYAGRKPLATMPGSRLH